MKTPFPFLRPWLAASLLAVASSPAAVPEEPLFGAISSATFAFTLTTTAPGTVAKDNTGKPLPKTDPASGPDSSNEWVVSKNGKPAERVSEVMTKSVLSKYSNKELLLDLVSFGVIEDIKGWSVVKVQATQTHSGREPVEQAAGPLHLYLTHKTKNPVCLTPYIKLNTEVNEAGVTYNSRSVTKLDDEGEPVPGSRTDAHAMAYKAAGFCQLRLTKTVQTEEGPSQHTRRFVISAMYSGGEKLALFGPDKVRVIVPTAAKMGSVIGNHSYYKLLEDDFTGGYIEGSLSFGAGVAKDLQAFPESRNAPGSFPE